MEDQERIEKSKNDMQLNMAKHQGYVPKDCYLNGSLVMGLIFKGENPCKGCNLDRNICGSKVSK